MSRRAFSLIEIAIVILIVGITAAAVTLGMQRPMRSIQKDDVIGAIVNYDRTARAAARQQDRPVRMVVDLSAGRIRLTDDAGRKLEGPTLSLPDKARIVKGVVRQQDCGTGEMAIPCSRRGLTPTYALQVENAGASQWIIIAGLSGQVSRAENEDQARKILAATAAGATLIEAVIGTVILGTLLVSVLLARIQMEDQSHRAVQRMAACEVIDELMNQWCAGLSMVPLNGVGTVPSHLGWSWRTSTQQRAEAEALHGQIVTVQVFAPSQSKRVPAAAIEILVPIANDETPKVQ